jgi:hypothetical protein
VQKNENKTPISSYTLKNRYDILVNFFSKSKFKSKLLLSEAFWSFNFLHEMVFTC